MGDKKAKNIAENTEKCRRLFNLPDTEDVIQNYSCLWGGGKGKLYITQNNLCWASALTSRTEKIPLRKVKSIVAARSLGLVSNAIDVTSDNEQYHFSGFVHRDEALNLMLHLWKHPPTFISLGFESRDETNGRESSGLGSSASSSSPAMSRLGGSSPSSASSSGSGISRGGGGGGWGSVAKPTTTNTFGSGIRGGGWGDSQITVDMVDTKTSENALRLAYEARQLGVDTIEELQVQAEQIDRIERNVENIHKNLDKGDRMIRGIESLGGHFKNQLTSQKQRAPLTFAERKIEWQKKRPEKLDVPILEKLSNDLLTPGTLRFEEAKFSALDENGRAQKGKAWSYDAVKEVAIRSRPLHLDIRFGRDRFRLASSYIQAIVNEFYFRVNSCTIIFEAGVKKFDYGSDMIVATTTSRDRLGGSGVGGFSFGVKTSTADLLSDNVSEEVKQAVRQQDKNLDQISYLVGEMGQMGLAMGVELQRQNEQLSHVTHRVDRANERLHNANNRIERQL